MRRQHEPSLQYQFSSGHLPCVGKVHISLVRSSPAIHIFDKTMVPSALVLSHSKLDVQQHCTRAHRSKPTGFRPIPVRLNKHNSHLSSLSPCLET